MFPGLLKRTSRMFRNAICSRYKDSIYEFRCVLEPDHSPLCACIEVQSREETLDRVSDHSHIRKREGKTF